MRRVSLLAILMLCPLVPAACSSSQGQGCPGSVTAVLTGVLAQADAKNNKGAEPLPAPSQAVIGLGSTVTWKAVKTGTAIDNKKASGDLPPPATTTTADTTEATTTTTNLSFGPTTAAAKVPPAGTNTTTPGPSGRPFTATASFGNQTLTVRGSIVGPPAPCHGIGSWTVTSPGNSQAGGGSWSF